VGRMENFSAAHPTDLGPGDPVPSNSMNFLQLKIEASPTGPRRHQPKIGCFAATTYGGRPDVALLPLHLAGSAQQLQQQQQQQQQNREGPLTAYTQAAGTYGPQVHLEAARQQPQADRRPPAAK
jgi:hypothetical protein